MLSDEEKKAIDYFRNKIGDFELFYGKKITTEENEYLKILLNLIEKQQKEIEELKEDNKHQWEERCKLTFELENSTSNDKIKAKMKEIKDRPVEDEFITASQGKLNAIIDMESLLEKE